MNLRQTGQLSERSESKIVLMPYESISSEQRLNPLSLRSINQFERQISRSLSSNNLADHYISESEGLFKEISDEKNNSDSFPLKKEPLKPSSRTSNMRPWFKNANTIKKIGRLILDARKLYFQGVENISYLQMEQQLSRDSKVKGNEVKMRDKFNTNHLKLLLSSSDPQLSRHNLQITYKVLTEHLRKNVFESRQIQDKSAIIYLNTMKCSALRCINAKLAVRLQTAFSKMVEKID